MAYDPAKAHEYYEKYRKKGLKKGREKGRKKTSSQKTSSLVGLNTGGLNDRGKMLWAMRKKELQDEMNEKLAGVTDPDLRREIMEDAQSKAFHELQKMKSDPSMASTKKSGSKSSGSKSSGRSSSRSSGGSSKSNGGSSSSGDQDPETKTGSASSKVSNTPRIGRTSSSNSSGNRNNRSHGNGSTGQNQSVNSSSQAQNAQRSVMVQQIQAQIDALQQRLASGELERLPEERKQQMRSEIQNMINVLKEKLRSN